MCGRNIGRNITDFFNVLEILTCFIYCIFFKMFLDHIILNKYYTHIHIEICEI